MYLLYDRIKESTTTVGIGGITLLGAATQFKSIVSRYGQTEDRFGYAIVGQTGSEWETGSGYLTGAGILIRETVEASSNGDALVNFSTGTKDVFVTFTAARANKIQTNGKVLAAAKGIAWI